MTEPLPDGWSVEETGGLVVLRMPHDRATLTHALSRNELWNLIQILVGTIQSVEPRANETLLHGFGSVGVLQSLEGWAVYVLSDLRIHIDVDPPGPSGHYTLTAVEAAALWRSLMSAYWLADEDISREIKEGTWLRNDTPENGDERDDTDGESPR